MSSGDKPQKKTVRPRLTEQMVKSIEAALEERREGAERRIVGKRRRGGERRQGGDRRES